MVEETINAIRHYPQGHGALGLLIRKPEPLPARKTKSCRSSVAWRPSPSGP